MITVKDQVSMLFGKHVADTLEEEGLLVRESHAPMLRSAGVVDDGPQFWLLKAKWDGVTEMVDWPSSSFDNELKQWLRNIKYHKTSLHRFSRYFEKAWPDTKHGTAKRTETMLRKFGASCGITVELLPAVLVVV